MNLLTTILLLPAAGSQCSGSCVASAQSMMSRLSSSTRPCGSTSTGTVPFGEYASSGSGMARSKTSRSSTVIRL